MQNWRDGLIESLNISINDTTLIKTENNNQLEYKVSFENKELGYLKYDK